MAKKQSLVILGTAPTMKEAPFEDDSFEIWGVSPVTTYEGFKRADRLFELHPPRYWRIPAVLSRLEDEKVPVYMADHYDEIPNSVRFPREEVKEMFHIDAMGKNLFVTNSITWMILLGLYEGYRDISFFGVHMAHETEYGYQAPSCSWALGYAQAMGCTIYLPEESQLLKARYEYGFDEPSELMRKMDTRLQGLKKGVDEASKQIKELEYRKAKTEGAVYEAEHWYQYVAGQK